MGFGDEWVTGWRTKGLGTQRGGVIVVLPHHRFGLTLLRGFTG
jgi:hypothetical protein